MSSSVSKSLTSKRLRELLDYDSESGLITRKVSRSNRPAGEVTGRVNSEGYRASGVDGKSYLNHRLAWLHFYGVWPSHEIDHIDGNRLNNKISNLRDVPKRTNMENQSKAHSNNKTTGLLGVSIDKKTGKFKAQIRVGLKKIHIGYYATAQQAHVAYVATKRRLHDGSRI